MKINKLFFSLTFCMSLGSSIRAMNEERNPTIPPITIEAEDQFTTPTNSPRTPRRSSIDSNRSTASNTSELNTSIDSWWDSTPESSPQKVPLKSSPIILNPFSGRSNDILSIFAKCPKSPYTKMAQRAHDVSPTPTPLPFSAKEEQDVTKILSQFIVNDLATKEQNFWRFHNQLSKLIPQLSNKSRKKILAEFAGKLNQYIATDPECVEDTGFSRLIGIVWGYNMLLPKAKRIAYKDLPFPVIENIKHITSPKILPGGKPTGYHLKNSKITKYPLTKVFSHSLKGVYAGLWGTAKCSKSCPSTCAGKCSIKCSTFFPDTWNAQDIEASIVRILKSPLLESLTTKELPLPAKLTGLECLLMDDIENDFKCVETIRLLGYGKDQVVTEIIFNTDLGLIITAYPILEFKVLPLKQTTQWGCTIGSHEYTYGQINAAIVQARKDPLAIRYTIPGYEVIDIAQTSIIKKNNPKATTTDFRGIYIQVPIEESDDPLGICTSSGAFCPVNGVI